jgi:hypothetical protein
LNLRRALKLSRTVSKMSTSNASFPVIHLLAKAWVAVGRLLGSSCNRLRIKSFAS